MIKKLTPRLILIVLVMLILISAINTLAAGNIVPPTRLDDQRFSVSPSDLAPAACASLGVTNLVTGSTFVFGTNANDLILNGNGGDWIFGLGGDDCIVGGGGDDNIFGGGGTDVCLGGPGNDSFNQCETQIQ